MDLQLEIYSIICGIFRPPPRLRYTTFWIETIRDIYSVKCASKFPEHW